MELLKLELKEEMAQAGAKVVILSILALSIFMMLLFLSIAAGVVINQWLGSEYLGYFIVAGFFLLAFIVFAFFRDAFNIQSRLEDMFRETFNSDDSDK